MAMTETLVRPGVRKTALQRFALAVDLGQSSDPTAIAILENRHVEEVAWRGDTVGTSDLFAVRHLQRLPLGLSYLEVVAEVSRLLRRPPLTEGCELVIDETGVGRPVGDLFEAISVRPTRVTITAGDTQTSVGQRRWHVAKSLLISALDARLHTGELRFAAALKEAGAMADELKDFRRKISAAGRFSFEARVGAHDDLVLAVAIGLWAFVGRPKASPAAFGVYGSAA